MSKTFDTQMSYRAPDFSPPKYPLVGVRDVYQRDLGRVIHSSSFRRLQAKTQVLGTGEGDFHRTRLTHSLEVGHIGRGLLWKLQDKAKKKYEKFLPTSELIEAICHAHDLGHPPYGHCGERALHQKMVKYGGFEGNAQTIRILTKLEKFYIRDGIQPTRRLLLGVLKYPACISSFKMKDFHEHPPKCYYAEEATIIKNALSIFSPKDVKEFCSIGKNKKTQHKTLDCSIMELADDIAYGIHDLEDGVARHILSRDLIEEDFKNAFKQANISSIGFMTTDELLDKLFSNDSCQRKHAISVLVSFLVEGVLINEKDVFNHPFLNLEAILPEDKKELLSKLKTDITFKHIINRREVQTLEFKGAKIISDLFDAYARKPIALIGERNLFFHDAELQRAFMKNGKIKDKPLAKIAPSMQPRVARTIADYIAGMTNPYADKYHKRLYEPGYGSSTDEL